MEARLHAAVQLMHEPVTQLPAKTRPDAEAFHGFLLAHQRTLPILVRRFWFSLQYTPRVIGMPILQLTPLCRLVRTPQFWSRSQRPRLARCCPFTAAS